MSNFQRPQWHSEEGAPPPPPLAQRNTPPEDRRVKWMYAGTGFVLGLIVMVITTPSEPATISATAPTITATSTVPGPTVTESVKVPGPETTVTVTAAAPKPKVAFGEGDMLVGEDIKPGKYKTAEPVGEMCYWGIYRGGSNHEDIIQNNVVTGGTPRVTLKAGQEFSSNGCGDWVRAD